MISPKTALLVSIRTEFSVLNPKPFPLCHMPSSGIWRDLTCQLPNSVWREKTTVEWAAWIRAGLEQESFEEPGKKHGSEKAAFLRADRWPLGRTGRESDLLLAYFIIYWWCCHDEMKGWVLAYSKRGYSPSRRRKWGPWSRRWLVPLCPQSGSRKKLMLVLSSLFSLIFNQGSQPRE